ncbi:MULTISPECIES: hypothetical protein [unclassified Streptomyces]|uniref:hypothetical protein n=1 Tax=unclassified Streptomyces TaxID=2593676 RepID=UPI002E0FE056|nr:MULTISPECIES: hypothetical protein [unclassified Streptomyces]WSR27755.1 hypothetical protein OG573_17390 [Streptomyces sp. NBC_01205]
MSERYEYVHHRLLHRRVRDIASGTEGELMAVVNENVSDTGAEQWMRLAYVRDRSGLEFTTAVGNIVSTEYIDTLEACLNRRRPPN